MLKAMEEGVLVYLMAGNVGKCFMWGERFFGGPKFLQFLLGS